MVLDELAVPIVQAPMGGGPSTVALAVAVGEAGALGFLAGGYLTAEAMGAEIRELRGRTERPFGVNVFVPNAGASDPAALEAYLRRLSGVAERYGVALGEPHHSDEEWSAKLEVLGEERPAVASFAFGCPPPEAIAALRARGISVWVTVTTPDEARIAAAAGADALVVQGVEAGGHQASFEDSDRDGLGLLALLRLIAAETDLRSSAPAAWATARRSRPCSPRGLSPPRWGRRSCSLPRRGRIRPTAPGSARTRRPG